jgi:thiamine-phosphate pyrophosphorylase
MTETAMGMERGGAALGSATGAAHTERVRPRDLLHRSGVYLVTEESLSAGRRSEQIVEAALASGVRAIQVREKDGSARRALEIAVAVRRLTRRYGALLIVNDRIDIALAAEAEGVHLGQRDLPVPAARRLLGEAALIGLSITDAAQLQAPDAALADYLGVGSVFPTGSKSDATLTGLALLEAARAFAFDQAAPTPPPDGTRAPGGTCAPGTPPPGAAPPPGTAPGERLSIVAIGGITAENAGQAVMAGADVVAVISAITAARDPGDAAAALLEAVAAARAQAESSRSAAAPR